MTSAPLTRSSQWPWVAAALTAALGFSITVMLWQARVRLEYTTAIDEFRAEADGLHQRVNREVRLFTDVLDSIRDLHSISTRITPDELEEFVGKGMVHQKEILGSFGFAQRISRDTRSAFESSPIASGSTGPRIVEPDDTGSFRPAGDRPEYFPLTYQTPSNGLSLPEGFDFNTRADDQRAVQHMLNTGLFAQGSRVSDHDRFTGVFIFAPIFYPSQDLPPSAPLYMAGFAAAILRPAQVLERAATGLRAADLRIEFVESSQAMNAADVTVTTTGTVIRFEAPVQVADRTWTFRCEAGPGYLRAKQSAQPLLLLAGGGSITALLTTILFLLVTRTRRTEKIVRLRTAALREAHDQLRREMAERGRLEHELLEISEREQHRVGRDLHDSLGQKLTGAVYLSRALLSQLADAGNETRESAEKINGILKDAVTQVRRIARGLAPVELEEGGLAYALRKLVEEARELYNVSCEFTSANLRLPGKTSLHLYHMVQEAIHNAVRHGGATHIRIRLGESAGEVLLTVEDDGRGIPDAAERKGGMGLHIMGYRAESIGGTLDIRRRPDRGTVLTCRFRIGNPSGAGEAADRNT